MKLSIISPVYMAEATVTELVSKITVAASDLFDDYELILVEDGSFDGSWAKIINACQENKRVKGVKLSRNFGQHQAISAGLEASTGDYVIIMDCDLQHDPVYFKDLVSEIEKGYDFVLTRNNSRKHSRIKNIFAYFFFAVFNWLSNTQKASSKEGSYSILSRKVVLAYLSVGDYQKHYLLTLRWLGFSKGYINIEHKERHSGQSSYNIKKLIEHALVGVVSQSDKLLRLAIGIGLIYFVIALISSLYLLITYYLYGYKEGWASTIVLILLSTGIILVSIGIQGLYIGKMFDQVRDRPIYIIDKEINIKKKA